MDILFIKSKVETVNALSATFQINSLKDIEESTEILVFTDNSKNIKLIKETYLNENGRTIIWNYIENNHAYFIFKEYYTYKLPTSDKNFDASKYTKLEEGFYLKNDRVIRWMQGKKQITKYPKNAASIENNMMMHIEDMITRFNQQAKG